MVMALDLTMSDREVDPTLSPIGGGILTCGTTRALHRASG